MHIALKSNQCRFTNEIEKKIRYFQRFYHVFDIIRFSTIVQLVGKFTENERKMFRMQTTNTHTDTSLEWNRIPIATHEFVFFFFHFEIIKMCSCNDTSMIFISLLACHENKKPFMLFELDTAAFIEKNFFCCVRAATALTNNEIASKKINLNAAYWNGCFTAFVSASFAPNTLLSHSTAHRQANECFHFQKQKFH